MEFRETLNKNPAIATGGIIVIIIAALAFIAMQFMGDGMPKPLTQYYFTIDDGANYFPDDANLVPPFKKNGKDAVRVNLFSCNNGKDPFAAYMERYTPEGKQKLEEVLKKGAPLPGEREEIEARYKEVKKVGGQWSLLGDIAKSADATNIKCPNGDFSKMGPVMP